MAVTVPMVEVEVKPVEKMDKVLAGIRVGKRDLKPETY